MQQIASDSISQQVATDLTNTRLVRYALMDDLCLPIQHS
jgi:hypothetical protein